MSVDDDFLDDDEESPEGSLETGGGGSVGGGGGGLKNWFQGKRGWMAIAALAFIQGIFAVIMILLRSDARPVSQGGAASVKDLAVEMLGHEVAIKQVYQLLPASGGKRMTVGLDIVLVLGQLPEEQITGAPHPTPEEFEVYMTAIRDMEPRIRSRVNSLLQRIPVADYGRVEVLTGIKEDIKSYINDSLDGLDFGKSVRSDLSKRRVTDVLLPMFVRQMM